MGPIAAMGVACAALSMLTLLPALLTIFGRRAFWPFVPHSTEWMAPRGRDRRAARGAGSSRARGSRRCCPVLGGCARGAAAPAARDPELRCSRRLTRGVDPVADRRPARPRALQAVRGAPLQARARRGRDPRVLEPGGRVGRHGTRRGSRSARSLVLLMLLHRPRLLLDRPDHERQLPHRSRVGRGPGPRWPELPRRAPARRPTSSCPIAADVPAVTARRRGRRRRRGRLAGRSPQGDARRARPGDARAAALLDGGLRPDRPDPRRGARGGRRARSSAGRPRSSSTSARPRRGTRR